MKTVVDRNSVNRSIKLFFTACFLLSSSVIFTGCPEDTGPISPDTDTSKNYFTADIIGDDYDMTFNAGQVTYRDDYDNGVTIRTITGNMLLNAIFYDLTITIYDNNDGKTRYAIKPREAKVKFVVSDPEIIDEFNINSNGYIDLIYNDESHFTGTFKFSIENVPVTTKIITLSNGRFNYNHAVTLIN